MGKKSGSGSGTRIIFPRDYKPLFGAKILKFFDAVPGSRMEKIPIRDKHPDSATLPYTNVGSGSGSPRSGLKNTYNLSTASGEVKLIGIGTWRRQPIDSDFADLQYCRYLVPILSALPETPTLFL
jgi:hypothetical protein